MIHRFLLTVSGVFFLSDSVIFLTYGIVTGDWKCIAVGVAEVVGAVALVAIGSS